MQVGRLGVVGAVGCVPSLLLNAVVLWWDLSDATTSNDQSWFLVEVSTFFSFFLLAMLNKDLS